MQTQSETPIANWMDSIPPEKVIGVCVPMYGYFKDLNTEQLNWESLHTFLVNLKSSNFKLFTVFVGETNRFSKNVNNVLMGRSQGGGFEMLDIEPPELTNFNYGEYLREGIKYLLDQTVCDFIIVANPWIMLKPDSIDQMAQRLNNLGTGMVAGVDLRNMKWGELDGIPADQFESFNFNPPSDFHNKDFDFNFWGMTRSSAQIMLPTIDNEYQTIYFQQHDLWGRAFHNGFEVISSQFLPFYSFAVDWALVDTEPDFEKDKQLFLTKWSFLPDGVKYK